MTNASEFHWECQAEAEKFLLEILSECLRANSFAHKLSQDLLEQTSTRLFDWVDHFVMSFSLEVEQRLEACGFEQEVATSHYRLFSHPGAQLPSLVLLDRFEEPLTGLCVKVESIADFLMMHGFTCAIEGSPYSNYRRACVDHSNGVSVWAVERRGTRSVEPQTFCETYAAKYLCEEERWKSRPRDLENEDESLHRAIELASQIVENLGRDAAAYLVLDCERSYWQSKNTAGQTQKNRQDRLGMGWANHDHHTFRSSRKHFPLLVRLFETLGFHCRERFYAGEEAGWGAQVMENQNAGLILFLDLDLTPEEVEIEFSHHSLKEIPHLGTVGLWCALHGESILQAGMHHLEAQFVHDQLTEDLSQRGIGMMEPFSNFSYLKQAFTTGELWKVCPVRIQKLERLGRISSEQAEKFLLEGAIGSHLENLERNEGYKGFNQKNVSFIIKKTDPRSQSALNTNN